MLTFVIIDLKWEKHKISDDLAYLIDDFVFKCFFFSSVVSYISICHD